MTRARGRRKGKRRIAGFFDKLRPTLNILTRRGGKGEEQSYFEEIVQLLALMKGEDIQDIRRLLERKIMENPALKAKISPKTEVKIEDIGSRLQLYRKPELLRPNAPRHFLSCIEDSEDSSEIAAQITKLCCLRTEILATDGKLTRRLLWMDRTHAGRLFAK